MSPESTNFWMIVGIYAFLLIIFGLLVYALFIKKNHYSPYWKYVLTLVPSAGAAYPALYKVMGQQTPSDSAVSYLGLFFLIPICVLCFIGLLDYISSLVSDDVLFDRMTTIAHEHWTNGRPIVQVAAEMGISPKHATRIVELIAAAKAI